MTRKLQKSFKTFDQSLEKEKLKIPGSLGMTGGIVEVPSRPAFVYVRLRNNRSELIQAFNDQVSPTYDLPVLVVREGNRYKIYGRDTERYQDWENSSPYLPRHSDSHRFSYDTGGGGDIVWVEGRQFLPAMVFPSGSAGAMNVLQSPYTLKDLDGNWKVIGNTGTANLNSYRPKSGSSLVLVSFDTVSGNPYLLATTGTYIPESFTGTASLVPYIPFTNNPRYRPEAFVRLVSGTQVIDWDNIYDVRQFITAVPTGTPAYTFINDEGVPQGIATTLNFVGGNVDVSLSGTVARVFVTGTGGGGTIYAQDEGGSPSAVNTFNFVGGNVDVSVSGTVARVFVTGTAGGSGDAIYLRLDTANNPLTGNLEIFTDRSDSSAIYVEHTPTGSSVHPYTTVDFFRDNQSGSGTFDSVLLGLTSSGKDHGGALSYAIYGLGEVLLLNPGATGTYNYRFDTAYPSPSGTYYAGFLHTGTAKFQVGSHSVNIPSGSTYNVGGIPLVSDEAYNSSTWNGSLEAPTKNAVRDKIESLSSASYILQVISVDTVIPTNSAMVVSSYLEVTSGSDLEVGSGGILEIT